jgi:hypothetical protein
MQLSDPENEPETSRADFLFTQLQKMAANPIEITILKPCFIATLLCLNKDGEFTAELKIEIEA